MAGEIFYEGEIVSDMGDDFNAMKKASQEKRADNREASFEILSRFGATFTSKSNGAHFIVEAGAKTVDFWPGTGLWIVRGDGWRKRGVRKLCDFITAERAK